MFSGQGMMIFLQNRAAKSTIKVVHDIIPGTVLRIKRDSKRMRERLRVTTIRLTGSLREKNSPAQKSREIKF